MSSYNVHQKFRNIYKHLSIIIYQQGTINYILYYTKQNTTKLGCMSQKKKRCSLIYKSKLIYEHKIFCFWKIIIMISRDRQHTSHKSLIWHKLCTYMTIACLDDDDDTFHVYSNNFNLLAVNNYIIKTSVCVKMHLLHFYGTYHV